MTVREEKVFNDTTFDDVIIMATNSGEILIRPFFRFTTMSAKWSVNFSCIDLASVNDD